MAYYHIPLSIRMLTLPLFLVLALATATGIGLWLSALNVQYRDVRYAVPFLTTFWQHATRIRIPHHIPTPEKWRLLYGLNPMTGVVKGFRWALLVKGDVGPLIGISVIIDLLMLFGGRFYFRRMGRQFRGCDLMNDVMIRTDCLGKRYRIGGPQVSYRDLAGGHCGGWHTPNTLAPRRAPGGAEHDMGSRGRVI